MDSSFESDKPFLGRSRTKLAIKNLALSCFDRDQKLTIYCGAGLTIDRSGLDWRKMVDGLLEPYVPDELLRSLLFEEHGILGVASLAVEYFNKDYPDHHRERIADRLRLLLYGPEDWQSGRLVDEVARLHKTVIGVRGECALVTPNYDDYLAEAVSRDVANLQIRTTTHGYPYGDPLRDVLPTAAGWVNEDSIQLAYVGSLVQLHGLVPSNDDLTGGRVLTPVIDELDYIKTERHTFEALKALFRKGPVLLVGTSMTDRPLLEALDAVHKEELELQKTRESRLGEDSVETSGHKRYVVIATGMKVGGDVGALREVRRSSIERFESFGVTPVYIDYYSQAAQFVAEISELINHFAGDASSLTQSQLESSMVESGGEVSLPRDYYSRIRTWSEKWSALEETDGGFEATLLGMLELLQQSVRKKLDISASETLKTEFWLRDDSGKFRGLILRSSTVSVHFQAESIRRAVFEHKSDISAVRAFLEGRPVMRSIQDSTKPHQRWRTYLAVPIVLPGDVSGGFGRLPVATIVIASMRPEASSGLTRAGRRGELKEAVMQIRQFGEQIVDVGSDFWGEDDSQASG